MDNHRIKDWFLLDNGKFAAISREPKDKDRLDELERQIKTGRYSGLGSPAEIRQANNALIAWRVEIYSKDLSLIRRLTILHLPEEGMLPEYVAKTYLGTYDNVQAAAASLADSVDEEDLAAQH